MRRGLAAVLAAPAFALALFAAPAGATTIQRVVSPGGIEAWLVQEPATPTITVSILFAGGAAQDPAGKAGTAYLMADLLDEGAGKFNSDEFHARLRRQGIRLSFSAELEAVTGSLRTLAANRDEAFDALRLALTAPRFDGADVKISREKRLSALREETTTPLDIAYRRWVEAAFPGHPYSRPSSGTLQSVPTITADDLRAYARRVLARENLKVGVVGDIDAETLKPLLDRTFGALPAKPQFAPVKAAVPQGLGRRIAVSLDVPQTVIQFGSPGIAHDDPDYLAASVINQILGADAISGRLYQEMRVKRGLIYAISSDIYDNEHGATWLGSTASGAGHAAEAVNVLEREVRRLAQEGPTAEELAKTKKAMTGALALSLSSSTNIASWLVELQRHNRGIDYFARRQAMLDSITLDDARRVAKRLLDGGLLIVVVGRPESIASAAAVN